MNLSNLITSLRIILSVFLCHMILENKINFFLIIIFLIAFGSDWLDGFLARKKNKITDFGKIFDPIADKILVFSILICFLKINLINAWLVIILLTREFLMSSARVLLAKYKIIYPANIYGKIKTVMQFLAIFIIIIFYYTRIDFYNNIFYNLGIFLMWCSAVFSFVSLFLCVYKNKNKFLKILGEI